MNAIGADQMLELSLYLTVIWGAFWAFVAVIFNPMISPYKKTYVQDHTRKERSYLSDDAPKIIKIMNNIIYCMLFLTILIPINVFLFYDIFETIGRLLREY